MNPQIAQAVLVAYAVLLAAGGVIGYLKARSRASLIAGLASAVIAGVAAWVIGFNIRLGGIQGALLAVVLSVFFGGRFRRTRKWMPAGMMMVVSQVVAVFLLVTVLAALSQRA